MAGIDYGILRPWSTPQFLTGKTSSFAYV